MKILLMILTIFILNGCTQQVAPCEPQPCVKIYPTLPTYRTPTSRTINTKPFNPHFSIINNDDLLELVSNNGKLRRICGKYAVVNKRVNKEYQ